MKTLIQKFGCAITDRIFIVMVNLLILLIALAAVFDASKLLTNLTNDFNEVEAMLDGIGIIFVAYGVALEERETMMKMFDLYPSFLSGQQEFIDRSCHHHGLSLLLVGLVMETTVEIVKLPQRILHTEGKEGVIFGVGFFFCFIATIVLIRHCVLLIRLPKKLSSEHQEG
ncbi:MAG: hypothetical protein FJ139_02655 [Deltaproteobacteria bacterium]|nr:hypothetical protein [Deltaproteobacteria bacterium]